MSKFNQKEDSKKSEKLYKENVKTDGITENVAGEQTIQTSKTKVLKENDKEILIGKDIKEIEKVEENFNTLQSRILNKY